MLILMILFLIPSILLFILFTKYLFGEMSVSHDFMFKFVHIVCSCIYIIYLLGFVGNLCSFLYQFSYRQYCKELCILFGCWLIAELSFNKWATRSSLSCKGDNLCKKYKCHLILLKLMCQQQRQRQAFTISSTAFIGQHVLSESGAQSSR